MSEFDFSIPLTSAASASKPKTKSKRPTNEDGDLSDMDIDDSPDGEEEETVSESRKLEQAFLLRDIQAAQMTDLVEATTSTHAQRSALTRLEVEIDKTLLQLLAIECREGEDRGMRALEMVQLMRDRTGRMIEAAGKVAERYGRTILGEKIREVGEKRMVGDDEYS